MTQFSQEALERGWARHGTIEKLVKALTLRRQGLTYREIGDQLGVGRGWARTRVRQAAARATASLWIHGKVHG